MSATRFTGQVGDATIAKAVRRTRGDKIKHRKNNIHTNYARVDFQPGTTTTFDVSGGA